MFIGSNITAAPVYDIYISKLIYFSRPCVKNSDFLDKAESLTQKMLRQGYVAPRLKSSFQTFYGRQSTTILSAGMEYPFHSWRRIFSCRLQSRPKQAVYSLRLKVVIPLNLPLYTKLTNTGLKNGQFGKVCKGTELLYLPLSKLCNIK